jgi:hypothetical protein
VISKWGFLPPLSQIITTKARRFSIRERRRHRSQDTEGGERLVAPGLGCAPRGDAHEETREQTAQSSAYQGEGAGTSRHAEYDGGLM